MTNLYNYTVILESFANYLIAEKISNVTIKNYLSDIRYFFGWFTTYYKKNGYFSKNFIHVNDGFILNPLVATYEHIIISYDSFLYESNSAATKRRRLYSLKKFIQFCLAKGLIYNEFKDRILNYLHIPPIHSVRKSSNVLHYINVTSV